MKWEEDDIYHAGKKAFEISIIDDEKQLTAILERF